MSVVAPRTPSSASPSTRRGVSAKAADRRLGIVSSSVTVSLLCATDASLPRPSQPLGVRQLLTVVDRIARLSRTSACRTANPLDLFHDMAPKSDASVPADAKPSASSQPRISNILTMDEIGEANSVGSIRLSRSEGLRLTPRCVAESADRRDDGRYASRDVLPTCASLMTRPSCRAHSRTRLADRRPADLQTRQERESPKLHGVRPLPPPLPLPSSC